ncbi:MAG TPA: hypothetical protein DHU59_08265, partial [Clostridiales bacterium]|nr:hypothetical protein [Clostridiales bacterium]
NYKVYVVNVDNQGAAKGKNKAQGGARVMHTTHSPWWDAKNRHDLPDELPFDYSKIAHIFENTPINQKTKTEEPKIETPKVEQPKQTVLPKEETKQQEIIKTEVPKDNLKGAPKALADLMKQNGVGIEEIQAVVAKRGYYPLNTPIENYDPQFITGVLVGAWSQVFNMILEYRAENNIFTPVTNDKEIPENFK